MNLIENIIEFEKYQTHIQIVCMHNARNGRSDLKLQNRMAMQIAN